MVSLNSGGSACHKIRECRARGQRANPAPLGRFDDLAERDNRTNLPKASKPVRTRIYKFHHPVYQVLNRGCLTRGVHTGYCYVQGLRLYTLRNGCCSSQCPFSVCDGAFSRTT